MKTISAVATLAFVGLLACEPVVDPGEVGSPSFASGGSGGDVVESITGSGHLWRPQPAPDGQFRTFSLTAQRQANGTVDGMFQWNNHGPWTMASGTVVCFTIIGKQAWLGLIIHRSDSPNWVGAEGALVVVDNGEGKNHVPDRISFIPGRVAGSGFAQNNCDNTPTRTLYDIEDGNIQIRP